MHTISQKTLKLIKNLLIIFPMLSVLAWGNEHFELKNAHEEKLTLRLAITRLEHTQGLSGLRPSEFKNSEGMLFVNTEMGPRRFWMPDTYFNLDIVFLDDQLKIVAIEKNVPAHPGKKEPPLIFKTETYMAKYILEYKTSAKFGKKIKVSDRLFFTGSSSLLEIESKIHQKQ